MGELFRRDRPHTSLAWTGERLVTEVEGAIESEHLHRYFLARDICRGKEVLDVASGEGYGSALLAQTAKRVVGVEIDPCSVEHSIAAYNHPNLGYLQGSATRLPVDAASVDAVVSFETLEHFFEHELFFAEVKRVLRPGGLLIISTPDALTYSGPNTEPNPFHVRELTGEEFSAELHKSFRNVTMYRQQVINGSAMLPDFPGAIPGDVLVYEQRDADTFEAHRQLAHAPYLVAVASDGELPATAVSVYLPSATVAERKPQYLLEMERLRGVEAAAGQQAVAFHEAVANAALSRQQIESLQAELYRLRAVEAAAREQSPRFEKALADHAIARSEATNLVAAMEPMKVELARLLSVEAESRKLGLVFNEATAEAATAREESRSLAAYLQESRKDADSLRLQLKASAMIVRQQALIVQIAQAPPPPPEPPPAPVVVDEPVVEPPPAPEPPPPPPPPLEKLLIPVWARKLVPKPLRPRLRAIKRALRS